MRFFCNCNHIDYINVDTCLGHCEMNWDVFVILFYSNWNSQMSQGCFKTGKEEEIDGCQVCHKSFTIVLRSGRTHAKSSWKEMLLMTESNSCLGLD